MPVRGRQEPVGIGKGLRISDPSVSFDQPTIMYSIRYNVATWEKNAWDGKGWQVLGTAAKEHSTLTETQLICDIPFVCRCVKPVRTNETSCTIKYDLRGYGDDDNSQYSGKYQIGCIRTFTCDQDKIIKMSRLYLDGCNFTEISIEG